MMNWLRQLLVCWDLAQRISWVNRPQWTRSDALELSNFLNSGAGHKLRLILQNQSLVLNQRAVFGHDEEAERLAAGFAFSRSYIEGMAQHTKDEDNGEKRQTRRDERVERLSP